MVYTFADAIGDSEVADFIITMIGQAINESRVAFRSDSGEMISRLLYFIVSDLNLKGLFFEFLLKVFPEKCLWPRIGQEISENISLIVTRDPKISKELRKCAIFIEESFGPDIPSSNKTVWKRLHLIRLSSTVSYDEIDIPNFRLEVQQKYQALVVNDYICHIPEKVKIDTEQSQLRNFDYGPFLADFCTEGEDLSVDANILYDIYKRWNFTNKVDDRHTFIQTMQQKYEFRDGRFIWLGLDEN